MRTLIFITVIITITGIIFYFFFTSDYANTDYFKPINPTIINQPAQLKVYSKISECYLNSDINNFINARENIIRLIYFQRDLRDGSNCFKIKINGKYYGFIQKTEDPQLDTIKINNDSKQYQKTLWIW